MEKKLLEDCIKIIEKVHSYYLALKSIDDSIEKLIPVFKEVEERISQIDWRKINPNLLVELDYLKKRTEEFKKIIREEGEK